MQEAVDDVLKSIGSEKKDIVILPPSQGDAYAIDVEENDVDEWHKSNLLPKDVAETL